MTGSVWDMSEGERAVYAVESRVLKTIEEHSMADRGGHIIAALSGGADSVCLLLVLKGLCADLGTGLSAVHVDHNLRGAESVRDREFCKQLCEKEGISIEVFSVDAAGYSAERGLSVEEAARVLRYGCFERAAEKFPGAVIATAHNCCDNTETVLFNVTRGTGVRGLRGIPYKRDNIIRPLLDVSREEIEKYLGAKGQEFMTDSTNLSDDCSRNMIRHNVIPELLRVNSGLHRAVSRLCESAAEDEDFLSGLAVSVPADKIADCHPAVRKRFIRNMLEEKGIALSGQRLCELDEALSEKRDMRIQLSGDIFAVFSRGVMEIRVMSDKNVPAAVSYGVDISALSGAEGSSEDVFIAEFDKTVNIRRINYDIFAESFIINKNLTNNTLDCAKIKGDVIIRSKRDGDSYIMRGRQHTTRLKKLYNGMKLPANDRACSLVMEDGVGIIWSEYGGAAERTAFYPDIPGIPVLIEVKRNGTEYYE